MENFVYQVTRLPRDPTGEPLVLAFTSKQSAQRLVAALAEDEGWLDDCKIFVFAFCARSGGRVDPERCSRLVIFHMKAIQVHKRFTVWQLYGRQEAIAKAKAHAQLH